MFERSSEAWQRSKTCSRQRQGWLNYILHTKSVLSSLHQWTSWSKEANVKNTSVTLADIPEESDVYSANWLSSGYFTVHVKSIPVIQWGLQTSQVQQNLTYCKSHTVQSCEYGKLPIKCKFSQAFRIYIRNLRDGWGFEQWRVSVVKKACKPFCYVCILIHVLLFMFVILFGYLLCLLLGEFTFWNI